MNKLVKNVFLGLLLMSATQLKAASFGDIFNSFTREPHQTFGESVVPIFIYDVNNGVMRGGTVTPFYKFGPFSLDAGIANPLNVNQTGTPVLGGSIHIDKLLDIIIPPFNPGIRSLFPQTAGSFIDKLVIGIAPIHNFNTPDNQSSLIVAFYSGIELKF